MRSIPILILILIPLFFLLLSGFSYLALKKISVHHSSRILNNFIFSGYWIVSIGIILFFIYLFIYPKTADSSHNYNIYFIFNVFLIADLSIKIIILLTLVPYFILLLFKIRSLGIIWIGFILSAGIIISVLYGATFGKNQISINKVNLKFSDLPKSFNNLKIVQISDIHLGSYNGNQTFLKKAFLKINSLEPDLILFTGDLVNNFSDELDGYDSIFNTLKARYGKISILGNHDYGNYYNWKDPEKKQKNLESIKNGHSLFGFTLLNNETKPISEGTDTIYITGVENWGHPPFPQYADLEKALKNVPANKFKILMTHDPAHWDSKVAGKKDIQLTLSGHTHGMQLGIRIAGIEFSPMYFIRKNWGGLYQCNYQYLNVNKGLGTIGIGFRIDMPPEITLLTLTTN